MHHPSYYLRSILTVLQASRTLKRALSSQPETSLNKQTMVPSSSTTNGHTALPSTASMETVVDAHVADIPPVIRAFKNQNTSAAAVKPARTLVLCFDGTGDQFDTDVSCRIIQSSIVHSIERVCYRTQTSSNSSHSWRRAIVRSKWSITRSREPSPSIDIILKHICLQAGIGTYTIPQVATPMMAKVEKTLDEMIAWNLNAHVMGR